MKSNNSLCLKYFTNLYPVYKSINFNIDYPRDEPYYEDHY